MTKHFASFDSEQYIKSNFDEKIAILYLVINDMFSEIKLCRQIDSSIQKLNKSSMSDKNFELIISNFAEKYVEKLETLIHHQWYTTCFTKNCDNAAVWGYYASSHTGVCLKFKTSNTEQGEKSLSLYGITGINGLGDIYEYSDYPLYEVNYSSKYPKLNFFNSLGQLPIPKRKDWLISRDGNRSIYADSISSFDNTPNNKHKQWSNQHWDSFSQTISTKLKDWEHEEEVRLVLCHFFDYTEKDKRKLKYRFSDLEGIIFGLKTSIEDKIKIINIINDKCKSENRTDFKIYQAFYNQTNGKIEHTEIRVL